MVDIVIPYYNANNTLKRALASIAMQVNSEDINIIIVDDNSEHPVPGDITDAFDLLGLNITVINLNENGGPGKARRIGMQAGEGKYIMFMDADDTLYSPFAVKHLVREMEKHEELAVITSYFLEELDKEGTFYRHEADKTWVFGKIYRRSYIEKHGIYFNDSRANEDAGFNAILFNTAQYGEIKEPTYVWHYNPNSITRINDEIYTFTCIEHYLYNMAWAVEKVKEMGADKERLSSITCKHFVISYFYYLQFYFSDDKRYDLSLFREWVKKYYNDTYLKTEHEPGDLEKAYQEIVKIHGNIVASHIPPMTIYDFINWVSK